MSDEEKLKYLEEAKRRAIKECLMMANSDIEKKKCLNLYSDLIEEIQDKKNQLEKQNQLSKTERMHKATECLNDLDDPTDEEAIEQCLDDLSDNERALLLQIRSQADKVASIYADLRHRKTFDNMAAKNYPLLPMGFRNNVSIATISSTNIEPEKLPSDGSIYSAIDPDVSKRYETEKTIKEKALEKELKKAQKDSDGEKSKQEKSQESIAKAKEQSSKIDKDIAETVKNISEIAKKKQENNGEFVDENGNPVHNDSNKKEVSNKTSPIKQAFIGKSDPTFTLAQYTPIEITLTSRVDATLTGIVSGVVSKDVWSANAKMRLIDKGTKVFGEYQSVKGGTPVMTRLMIVFTKAITPDGVVIPLADAQAAGMLGEAGVAGYVNNHFMQRIGFAMMASVVNTLLQTIPLELINKLLGKGGGTEGRYGFNYALGQAINGSMQSSSQMSRQILGELMNIPPSFYKNEGDSIKILTLEDIDFSSVYDIEITNKAVVEDIIKQSTKTLSREHTQSVVMPKKP